MYARPPRESKDNRHYLLLLVAEYGVVSANGKLQKNADDIILRRGLQHLDVVPQLFYLVKDSQLVLLVVKSFDDP